MASPSVTARSHASRRSAFTTLEQETVLDELQLSGELPSWLSGSLLRTGPAKFEVGEQAHAPLVRRAGDAAPLHGRRTGACPTATATCRAAPTAPRSEQGRMVYGEFATDPCRSLFKRVQTLFSPGKTLPDNANINVTRLGERYIAMTETPMPVQFDPHTLRDRRRAAV